MTHIFTAICSKLMGFTLLAALSGVYTRVTYSADNPVPWFGLFRELNNTLALSVRTDKQGIKIQFWPATLSDTRFERIYVERAVRYAKTINEKHQCRAQCCVWENIQQKSLLQMHSRGSGCQTQTKMNQKTSVTDVE